MRAGVACLVMGYVLSQFYRAFLAVLSPVLGPAIGASAGDLAISSGLWFLTFALMQIPVGEALDRIGPRRTASVLLAVGGGGGALVFAFAQGPMAVHVAMALIGVGCSPVLMACYYLFARSYAPAAFGILAGAVISIGSLGNIAGSVPLALLVDAVGWRVALLGLAGVTLLVAAATAIVVRDPARAQPGDTPRGTLLDILRIPRFWAILPLMAASYAPTAAIRGLWAGPMLSDIYGADTTAIGHATLAMGLAMVVGNFAYGSLDRIFGSWKWPTLAGSALAALVILGLALFPAAGFWTVTALLAALGFFTAAYPAIMAHGRSFLPPHLVGRGVTFINLFSIGGAGLLQFSSGPVFRLWHDLPPQQAYAQLMVFFLAPLVMGVLLYLFTRDRPT